MADNSCAAERGCGSFGSCCLGGIVRSAMHSATSRFSVRAPRSFSGRWS